MTNHRSDNLQCELISFRLAQCLFSSHIALYYYMICHLSEECIVVKLLRSPL